jgi:hypothetical protein
MTRLVRPVRRTPAALLLLVAAACSDPQVATTVQSTATVSASATVAASVGTVPVVRILDAKGKAMKGVMVRWRATGGGRVVNDSVRSLPSGEASSGGWTLGTTAGQQTLTATADGIATPFTFTVTAAPGPVATLVRVSPDAQTAPVNTTVASPPSVRAEDQYANVVPGVAVTFGAVLGGGTVTGESQTTNAQGIATASAWRLGTAIGQQLARAVAGNAQPAAFSATAVAGPPANLVKVAGDAQEGVSGVPVGTPPGVRVVDEFANPVGNVPVTFTPGAGSGSVTAATTTTDPATGTAFVGSWTLGSAATQTLVATSSAIPGRSATFTATAVQSQFNVDIRFVGDGGTQDVRDSFTAAAAKWRRVIIGDVHTVPLNIAAGQCGASWLPAVSESINDVIIYARIAAIDGPGSILARAGPCYISTSTGLPILGVMEFDLDDMANLISRGLLTDVVLHEMGHVLGVGTLWNFGGRTLLNGAGTADPFFSGTVARAQFAALNTVTYAGNPVPVENTGGSGTRDAHWRETVFGRELMQGYAKAGGMPLSRITTGSLQDLGYLVNLNASDSYSLTAPLRLDPFGTVRLSLEGDVRDAALVEVDAQGRQRLVRPARQR